MNLKENEEYQPLSITIIGGYGALGKWFARFFHNEGWSVKIYGRDAQKLENAAIELEVLAEYDFEQVIQNSEVIMISVPISDTPNVMENVISKAKPNTTIIEITSIKKTVFDTWNRFLPEISTNLHCLSIHPMFGPGTQSLENKKIVFIKIADDTTVFDYFWQLFSNRGAQCHETSMEEHDQIIARVLGDAHFISMAFMTLLSLESDPRYSLDNLLPYAGTTFTLQKTIAESVLHESPTIYGTIQLENSEFLHQLECFRKFLDDYIHMVQNKDLEKFTELFENLQTFAEKDPSFSQAYDFFYKMFNALN
jgi:prephenate dehydrogenase